MKEEKPKEAEIFDNKIKVILEYSQNTNNEAVIKQEISELLKNSLMEQIADNML